MTATLDAKAAYSDADFVVIAAPTKTAVGDKYVYEYMAKNGCRIGGEQSGHIIFSKYASTGDGILTSLKMMEVMWLRITTMARPNKSIDNANKRKSRDVTHSFGMKLRALMLGKEVEITFCDVQRTKKKYKFTDEERLSFVLFGILYASRCNNSHGNVAARMNSINANKDTFKISLMRDVSLMSRLQLRAICLMLRVPAFWTSSLAAW